MKVSQLTVMQAANKYYPDQFLENYYDKAGVFVASNAGDTLAQFIVSELNDAEGYVEEAIRVLERARRDLEGAIKGLEELDARLYS